VVKRPFWQTSSVVSSSEQTIWPDRVQGSPGLARVSSQAGFRAPLQPFLPWQRRLFAATFPRHTRSERSSSAHTVSPSVVQGAPSLAKGSRAFCTLPGDVAVERGALEGGLELSAAAEERASARRSCRSCARRRLRTRLLARRSNDRTWRAPLGRRSLPCHGMGPRRTSPRRRTRAPRSRRHTRRAPVGTDRPPKRGPSSSTRAPRRAPPRRPPKRPRGPDSGLMPTGRGR
jgi:hypothetical protein